MKRLSAVVGEYTDKQSSQQKGDWANVGIIGVSSKGKEYMLLDEQIPQAHDSKWPRKIGGNRWE